MALENLLNLKTEVQQILSDLEINDKLQEMDDFMNQNELQVTITNNDDLVDTGLVTYTCTVKDKDDNPMPKRVVEWYHGTELIGIDSTNSSGVSTMNVMVNTADAYDVHAIVKGTHAGDDYLIYVKEPNNILPENIWSATAYEGIFHSTYEEGTFTFTAQGGVPNVLHSSTAYAKVGTRSLKSEQAEANKYYELTLTGDFDTGCMYVLNMNVHNPGVEVTVSLAAQDTTSTVAEKIVSTTVAPGDDTTSTDVSIAAAEMDAAYNRMKIRVTHSTPGTVYTDNWRLLKM